MGSTWDGEPQEIFFLFLHNIHRKGEIFSHSMLSRNGNKHPETKSTRPRKEARGEEGKQ